RLAIHLNDRHQVEPKEGKVRKVVASELFALQMSMHTPQPAEPARGGTCTTKVGHLDSFGVSHHYVFDLPLSIEQHADLTARLVRDLAHLPSEFLRNYVALRNAAGRQPLDAL